MKKAAALGTALVWLGVTLSSVVVASGSGHGGGHSGGGHAASGGHASGGHAGGSTHAGAAAGTATPRSAGTSQPAAATSAARPRTGQPVVGTAVPRTTPKVPTTVSAFSYPLYGGWPYYSVLGFGGLGFYTDPFLLGPAYSTFAYSPGYFGFAVLPPYPLDADGPTGGLRLKVEPKQAQVYVDGYYAGIVDDFNGVFHHLDVTSGPHHLEIRAPGYESLTFDVNIQTHHTIEYRGSLPRSNP